MVTGRYHLTRRRPLPSWASPSERARAIRRCGELLQTYEKGRGGELSHATYIDNEQVEPPQSRSAAAREFGLKTSTKNTALRVANIPEVDFDAAIESDDPPTITALAEQGTAKKYMSPAEIIGDRDPARQIRHVHPPGNADKSDITPLL